MASVAVVVKTISFFVTPNCWASVSSRNTTTKKSKASRVHPRNPARTAWCEALDCFMGETVAGLICMRETVSLLRAPVSKQIDVKENPREAGGKSFPGWGMTEGGRGKLSVDLRCHLANLAKLFISKERLFLIPGTLFVPESGLFRNPAQLVLGYTKQRCRAFLRNITKFEILHAASLRWD